MSMSLFLLCKSLPLHQFFLDSTYRWYHIDICLSLSGLPQLVWSPLGPLGNFFKMRHLGACLDTDENDPVGRIIKGQMRFLRRAVPDHLGHMPCSGLMHCPRRRQSHSQSPRSPWLCFFFFNLRFSKLEAWILPPSNRSWLVGCRLWGRRVGHDWSDLAAAAAADVAWYTRKLSIYISRLQRNAYLDPRSGLHPEFFSQSELSFPETAVLW